jgi:uncharacterized protein DUF6314
MLASLCGSQNVQKILLFLFVNGKCYGTQLHRVLKTPLTPLQKALSRLEKGGIILSDYEGKTRIYQFNPAFPLLTELEQLLKKAYTLLPPQEKRFYCSLDPKAPPRLADPVSIIVNFWDKLTKVKQLKFTAKLKNPEEGSQVKRGQGEVIVTKESPYTLVFHEKGTWNGPDIGFSNHFRWTLDRQTAMISLEHLRRGVNNPVFLFNLIPASRHSLVSEGAHLCADDAYFGQLTETAAALRLKWRVIGPRKNEEMDYYYL